MIMVRREIVLVAMFVITMMIFEDHDDGRDIDDQNDVRGKKELWIFFKALFEEEKEPLLNIFFVG